VKGDRGRRSGESVAEGYEQSITGIGRGCVGEAAGRVRLSTLDQEGRWIGYECRRMAPPIVSSMV